MVKKKTMFRSQAIQIFVFLWNPQISKSGTPWKTLLHNGSYTFASFFWTFFLLKFGQIIIYLITNISNTFWLNVGDGKLILVPFITRSVHFYKLILTIFNSPLFALSKKWNTGNLTWLVIEQLEKVAKLKRAWNLAPVL